MYTQRRTLRHIKPEQLDAYLARGWYRMGQMIFTCQFLFVSSVYLSTIWIRLNLTQHRFRKSQRKLMRQNGQRFCYIIQPAVIDEAKEELYQRYRADFKGHLSQTLKVALQDDTDHNVYNTYEVAVYDENRLVAFSFFDLGARSIASIKGVFDPAYGQYSLGYYTMLLEIQYGLAHGFEWYYPGYIVPGYAKFDYKKRIGAVEYWEFCVRTWKPFVAFDKNQNPVNILRVKIDHISQILTNKGVSHRYVLYPLYEANMMGYWEDYFYEHPFSILLLKSGLKSAYYTITYDLYKKAYLLYVCIQSKELYLTFSEKQAALFQEKGADVMFDLLVKHELVLQTNDIQQIVDLVCVDVYEEE